MKDKTNWLSRINSEEVSMGLDKISHELKGKVVCLHANMGYGVPDSMTIHLIKNFKDLGIKKLIITSFPISDEPEEWAGLLEGEKYVIEKVPSKLTEDHDYYHHQGNGGSYLHRYPLTFSFPKGVFLSLSLISRMREEKVSPHLKNYTIFYIFHLIS